MSETIETLLGVRPLQIGDRVQVRLSGECEWCTAAGVEIVDGAIGTVGQCPFPGGGVFGGSELYRHEHAPGHDVNVQFDRPIQSGRWGIVYGGCYSRAELSRRPDWEG